MSYYFTTTVPKPFEETIDLVTDALKQEGFGVLTNINIRETFKNKLDIEFRNYAILGACNPGFAHKALQSEDKIGTMLPCNVIVQEHDNGQVEVSAIDPITSMQAVDNENLGDLAAEVQQMLKRVIERL